MRRAENKRLRAWGDERLKATKYHWLRHSASFSETSWQLFRSLRESDLKTARAWALKETAMRLFEYRSATAAQRFFALWQGWATRSRLAPVVAVAKMLKARLENVLTYLKQPSPTPSAKRSTPRSNGSKPRPATSVINRTSSPPSTSIAEDSTLLPSTKNPEEPFFLGRDQFRSRFVRSTVGLF